MELHDGSYSVSDNQGYFEYIIKMHETLTDNSSIKTMKLLGSTKNKINKHENKSMVILLAMIITKIQESYRHLLLKNLFHQLLDISPKIFSFKKTFNSEFSYIEVWFTDQNSKPLGIEDKNYYSY